MFFFFNLLLFLSAEIDDVVPMPKEIEALSLEASSFSTSDVVEVSLMLSDHDFQDPHSRPPIRKPASNSLHKTKVGQPSGLLLKPLCDRVDEIDKIQQALAFNQKKMMDQISTMKTAMSANFSTILAILSNLQGNWSSRYEGHPMSPVIENEVFDDVGVHAMEVYYYTLYSI